MKNKHYSVTNIRPHQYGGYQFDLITPEGNRSTSIMRKCASEEEARLIAFRTAKKLTDQYCGKSSRRSPNGRTEAQIAVFQPGK